MLKPAIITRSGIIGALDYIKAVEKAAGYKLDKKQRDVVAKAYRIMVRSCKPVKRSNCKTSTAFASGIARPKGNTQGEYVKDWSYDRFAK